uniref:Centrosomal protein POC5 n=1 Tax=Schistosoma mansoni TaxID=6183 RepID=A0A3Q0KM20_SCHMA
MLSEGRGSEINDTFSYSNDSSNTNEYHPEFDSSSRNKTPQNDETQISGESNGRLDSTYLHSKQCTTGICDYSHELIDLDKIKHENLFSNTKLSDINTIYDHAASKLKENLTAHYQSVQEEIMSSVKNLFSAELKRIKTDMIKLHEQVISLRDLARNHEGTIARKEQMICDLTNNINKLKIQMEINLKKENAKRKVSISFCIKLADRYYKQTILKQAIIGWKQFMEYSWKQRNFRRLTLEAQSECIKIKQELNQKILQLEADLKISQSELESMKAKQANEQAALKTALMRGVCALNMETMAVFNETLPNLNKEFLNKKLNVDSQILNKNDYTNDHLELAQLTSNKSNGYHFDRTIHNQSNEMIFNIQSDHIVQATHQSNTGFSDQNRENSMEAWPRDTIRNVEPSYSNVMRKSNCAKPLSHSTEICERWLGRHSDYNENDPLNLSGLPTYKAHDHHLHTIQSLSYQVDEKISNSDQSELEHGNQMDNKWLPNKDLAPNRNHDTSYRININSTNSKHEKSDRSFHDGKNHTPLENAKKMLSSRNSSNRIYSTMKPNKLSSYSKPQTVQHGIPTGNYPNGSKAMVNILVHRHQTGNQINSTENVNTHKSTTNSTGIPYSHCQHNLSSTPRLYSDSYSHRHV